jgi:hypothetical protein
MAPIGDICGSLGGAFLSDESASFAVVEKTGRKIKTVKKTKTGTAPNHKRFRETG